MEYHSGGFCGCGGYCGCGGCCGLDCLWLACAGVCGVVPVPVPVPVPGFCVCGTSFSGFNPLAIGACFPLAFLIVVAGIVDAVCIGIEVRDVFDLGVGVATSAGVGGGVRAEKRC